MTAVDPGLVGRSYLGQILPAQAAPLLAHLWKRVLVDRQWAIGTTPDEYLQDIRQSVIGGHARVVIAIIRASPSAGVLAVNRTPASRLGPNAGPLIFVGYSVNGGTISTAYQVIDQRRIVLPRNARWLN